MKSRKKASRNDSNRPGGRFLSLLDQATLQTPLYVRNEIAQAEDRDERKTEWRWGGWFLILRRMGRDTEERSTGGGGRGTVSRINSRLPADSIDGRFPSRNSRRWRPRCFPSVTGAKNEHEKSLFASGGTIFERNKEIMFPTIFDEWRTAGGRNDELSR